MSEEPFHNSSKILREAGYLPLPRLWVKAEDMTRIHAIAHESIHEIHSIRTKARLEYEAQLDLKQQSLLLDKEAAWAAYEKDINPFYQKRK